MNTAGDILYQYVNHQNKQHLQQLHVNYLNTLFLNKVCLKKYMYQQKDLYQYKDYLFQQDHQKHESLYKPTDHTTLPTSPRCGATAVAKLKTH